MLLGDYENHAPVQGFYLQEQQKLHGFFRMCLSVSQSRPELAEIQQAASQAQRPRSYSRCRREERRGGGGG
jgi:hypothetical protein